MASQPSTSISRVHVERRSRRLEMLSTLAAVCLGPPPSVEGPPLRTQFTFPAIDPSTAMNPWTTSA